MRRVSLSERFWSKVQGDTSCWLWLSTRRAGYGGFRIHGKYFAAHRVAWMLSCGPIPHGLCVLHTCDNPLCVRPSHLFLGTKSDNRRDCVRKGRAFMPDNRGARCAKAKLTEVKALEVKRLGAEGNLTQREIALEYGIDRSQVSRITHGKRWSYLGQPIS